MPFGVAQLRKISTDHLPGPIATTYRRIFTRHEPDVERLMFVLDTAEVTARLLAAITLCALRELVQKGSLAPPILTIGDPSVRLKKPSFGLWMEILREGTRRLRQHDDWSFDAAARSLAMDVSGFVFDDNGKMQGRPYEELELILRIRNKVHHPDERLEISQLCEKAEQLLTQTLTGLQFFDHYTLYVVKHINMRHRRLQPAVYQHQCFLLQGEIDFPTAASDARKWHTETEEVLIYRSDDSYLNLDPLFIYLHADDIVPIHRHAGENSDALQPGMYSLGGFSNKDTGIVVEYQPCVGSTKSFRTSNQAFRNLDTTRCWNAGIEELLRLCSASPTSATSGEQNSPSS